jgi:ADP-ribose pyrophosphatase YjhB (NUDIX family)
MKHPYKFCPNDGQPLTRLEHDKPACSQCDFVQWDNPIPVVAVLITIGGGVVAIQRKLEPCAGGWCLPCGFVDCGEDPGAAAVRETKEEAGLDVRVVSLLRAMKAPTANQIVMFYHAEVVGGALVAGDDATQAKVFARAALPKLCFSLHDEIVREFAEKLGVK